jgi:CRP-like cAMP-binding protein
VPAAYDRGLAGLPVLPCPARTPSTKRELAEIAEHNAKMTGCPDEVVVAAYNAKIARLLLELFVRHRMRWPGHQIEDLYLPLTQEHIGDAPGLTGVHVNRMLRDLMKKEIIQFQYRHLRNALRSSSP